MLLNNPHFHFIPHKATIPGEKHSSLQGFCGGGQLKHYPALFMKAKTGKTKPNIYTPIYGGTNLISKK